MGVGDGLHLGGAGEGDSDLAEVGTGMEHGDMLEVVRLQVGELANVFGLVDVKHRLLAERGAGHVRVQGGALVVIVPGVVAVVRGEVPDVAARISQGEVDTVREEDLRW